ncbi:MAG TPA: PEP-CTERM sorting domain-containing protein [Burkholderiales bacterium]|nr:PEP-CTERM sorting domain-containing protein [Burkholderiales bacterium]
MNIRRTLASALTVSLLIVGSSQAALLYQFSGTTNGGTASATMLVDIVGNTLTATINNTSPNPSPNPGNLADPAITGFGFQFNSSLTMSSWCLSASGGTKIGGTCAGATTDWLLETSAIDGVLVDFGGETDKGVKGGLYAPGADNLGGPPQYYTEAIFTLVFTSAPTIEQLLGPNCSGANGGCSPFMRFQNVGANGGGSLKLPGVPDRTTRIVEVPEPGTLALMGLTLAMLGLRRRA